MKPNTFFKQYKKQGIFFMICLAMFMLSCLFYSLCEKSPSFAKSFITNVSSPIRIFLSRITNYLPFSVGEALVIILVFALLFYFVYYTVCIFIYKKAAFKRLLVFTMKSIAILMLIASISICDFFVLYDSVPLSQKFGFESRDFSELQLVKAAEYCVQKANRYSENLTFLPSGASILPYSRKELNQKLNKSYNELSRSYDFIPHTETVTKNFASSSIMTYTHISGMYIPFTGEANVNINYPDYVIAFTYAHEMAHQRGIASEDEANFLGFIALVNSNDDYLCYCGFLTMLDYLFDELYSASPSLHAEIYSRLNRNIVGENSAYSDFFKKYAYSTLSEIADKTNDSYLKSQGEESGTESYSECTGLFISFLTANKII